MAAVDQMLEVAARKLRCQFNQGLVQALTVLNQGDSDTAEFGRAIAATSGRIGFCCSGSHTLWRRGRLSIIRIPATHRHLSR
jgi:hypothetical protein